MKLKVGDKVKFLNQTGGGIVTKIVSSQIVNVTDDTGFDIPTLIKDLIKVEPMQGAGKLFEQDIDVEVPAKQTAQSQETISYDEDTISALRPIPEVRNIDKGIYLAFVPHEQRWLITGDMDVYIVNRTPYTFLVSIFLQSETAFAGIDYSAIAPESKMYIDTIGRENIDLWMRGIVQGMFHYDSGKTVLNTVSADFKVKGSRFYKEESYVEIGCLSAKALLISLAKLSDVNAIATIEEMSKPVLVDKDDVQQEPIVIRKAKVINPGNVLEQYFVEPNVAEVDLHIEALYPNCNDLDDHSKFEIQMDFFRKCLNDAIINHVQKVIFIHGVGSGVLKNEIIKELKKYKGLHYFDASMAKYGVGATEVYFSQNTKMM